MNLRELPLRRYLGVLVPAAIFLLAMALFVPYLLRVRQSAQASRVQNQMRQMGLALQSYHDTFRSFPPGG